MEAVRIDVTRLEPRAGRLLVATPSLQDENFVHTLVLLLDHDQDGSLGVVLNRPTDVSVSQVLSPWELRLSDPGTLFRGGPVSTDSALAVASLAPGVADVPGWRTLSNESGNGSGDGIGLIDLDAPHEVLEDSLSHLRVYAGYAGWSAGQLDEEIAESAWVVVPAEVGDAFTDRPEQLWHHVLRRQGGLLGWLATMPLDPAMN